jgi:short subunit dehydrogenase-like uncharacterized protein
MQQVTWHCPMAKEFDLVLQGATGFTGRLAAAEIAHRDAHKAGPKLRWAIAGRNEEKLQALAEQFKVPYLIAPGLDDDAVDALAQQTRVVISCAGPFSRFGTPLVDACVRHQTHYADLTGELPWVHLMIHQHHQKASESGTALLPASGFDSVPTDLAVFHMVRHLQAKAESTQPAVGVLTGHYKLQGGFNGGTIASGLELYEKYPDYMAKADRNIFKVPALNCWAAPFLMAPVNEWVVRRSAELLEEAGQGYGEGFDYHEYMSARSRFSARALATVLRSLQSLMEKKWGRGLIRKLAPNPGKGPSQASRHRGFAHLRLLDQDGESVGKLMMNGDPSNLITVRCLVQVGLALAAGEAQRGGVVTSAAAFGDTLIERLRQTGDQFIAHENSAHRHPTA